MISIFLHKLLRRRHFWRTVSFSEVAELYASRLLRMLALHMVALFIALYLYKNGYSITFIAFYYACYYVFKVLLCWPSALFAAQFGPKHGILISNFLYIPALVAFTFVSEYGFTAIVVFGVFQALSATLYELCYQVDFSKVKHANHAGKEIGIMSFVEKFATGVSPLIGGAVATLFGAEVTIWLAAILFAISAGPLMKTAEPLKTGQSIRLGGISWRAIVPSMRSEVARGFDVIATGMVWVLFVAVVIFSASSDDIYVQIGALSSVGFLITFVAAFTFGKLIDRRQGRALLLSGVAMKAITHLFRPVTATPIGVASLNLASETASTGYYMAYLRGLFDNADRSENRIGYLLVMEMAVNFGAAIGCALLGLFVWNLGDVEGMSVFFVLAAFVSVLLGTAKFALYRKTTH
ncbi:MFS transporter [Candidatus Saccharibacteria bacterium]|nr:MFS transporter [Candidatus Saccharibacteria bacterium]